MSNPAPGFNKHPDHRVAIMPSSRHVRVRVGDEVIADTRAPLLVEESRHDAVWYIPPRDVRTDHLVATDTSTYCPFKGHASYVSVAIDGARVEDAAWIYRTPFDECEALAGYYAFYPERVTLEVDDGPQRPT